MLTKENRSLKEYAKSQQMSIDELNKIKAKYYNEINGVKKVRDEYKKLIEDVLVERKKFLSTFSQNGEANAEKLNEYIASQSKISQT